MNFAIALVVCGFCLLSGYAQQPGTPRIDADSPEGILEVNIMSSPGVPLKLDRGMANITRADGSSVLRFSATNIGNTPVTGFYAVLFVKDAYGRLKRGEGWRVSADIGAKSTESFSRDLRSKVKNDELVVLALHEVTNFSGLWRVDRPHLLRMARIANSSETLVHARFAGLQTNPSCPTNFCREALAQAKDACNSGLSSFACDQATCNFQFSCREIVRD
ncbi:MAG TPA: hypothetical protein VNH22_06080 [Blastocatellia bacterium]|jgi:hypothetical protein|nr:hypothetical protein [Blastocatellia bacterium]